jgi:hypothetical protein
MLDLFYMNENSFVSDDEIGRSEDGIEKTINFSKILFACAFSYEAGTDIACFYRGKVLKQGAFYEKSDKNGDIDRGRVFGVTARRARKHVVQPVGSRDRAKRRRPGGHGFDFRLNFVDKRRRGAAAWIGG